jgi:RNA polymerase sigma factor for flagellar operon FliA
MVNFAHIWERYKHENDLSAKEALVLHYLPMVRFIAKHIATSLPPFVDREDLVSVGTLGLLNALERYDPARGISFETYAKLRIHGIIIDELRAMDWMPRSLRRRVKSVEKAHTRLEHRYGRRISDRELAEEMDIPVEDVEYLTAESERAIPVYLEECVLQDGEGKMLSLIDRLEDTSSVNPIARLEEEEMCRALEEEIEYLSENEKMIILLYYYEELTLREIGYILNLSESRISQIHSKILKKLKNKLDAVENQSFGETHSKDDAQKVGVC